MPLNKPGNTLPADLNPAQRDAVMYLNGPCLVLAGAGSGKTRVITQKIAYLLRECGYSGRHIIALTFTNKAAREMSERIRNLTDKRLAKGLTVCTFHALGVRFLREEAPQINLKPQFSIFDATDALAIIQELLATTDKARLRAVQQTISLWKNAMLGPDEAARRALTPSDEEAARVYRSYEATLNAYQAVDFDDLVRLPVRLLQESPGVRERWQKRVQYLLVDEYQDTNECQYRLVQLLTGDRAQFTAVGDDDQAIYAWRGATVENLAKLTTDYANLKLIKLEQNYRSVQRILSAANSVISHNPNLFNKKLWSEHGDGESIGVKALDSDEAEAQWVGLTISGQRFDRRAQWRDFAVLYRSNQQARVLEQALRNLRIPYIVSGGQSFFDKAEIRDVVAYLRLLVNEADDPSFIRAVTTPRRGVGQGTLKVLGQFALAHGVSLFEAVFQIGLTQQLAPRQLEPLEAFGAFVNRIQARARKEGPEATSAILDELISAIGYERHLYDTLDERQAQARWQNVLDLMAWLKRKAKEDGLTVIDLVQHVALVSMLERHDEADPDAVKLSTLHASKGLEYPHVFLVGVEEGLLPHMGREDDEQVLAADAEMLAARVQEERRLMYVGITRAQRTLTLSWCKRRRRAREDVVREPSRFISEMGLVTPAGYAPDPQASYSPKQRLDALKALLQKT